MEDFIVTVILSVCCCLYLRYVMKIYVKKRYAPGPWGIPFVGHLPLLGLKPTDTFRRWNKAYGNVFRIQMGSWETVVLNGYSTVKNAMERQDDVFSSRPDFYSTKITKHFLDDENSIGFGPFDDAYLKHRKFSAYALRKFTNPQNDYLQGLILDEAEQMVEDLLSLQDEVQNIEETVTLYASSIIYQILFGKGIDVKEDQAFRHLVKNLEDFTELVASGSVIDALPWLKIFLRKKLTKYIAFVNATNEFVWKKIREHKNNLDKRDLKDVTDVFLAANLPKTVKDKEKDVSESRQLHTLSDLLGAGFGTVSRSVLWMILYVTKYPEVQRRVQREIDAVVGRGHRITLKDKSKLHYTQATMLEVMRLSNLFPSTIPHYTTTDTTINGYNIDKGTVVIVNLTSVHQDETIWENPAAFNPERHLDSNLELQKHNYVLPFGLGRRRCLGEFLAKAELFLLFSTLMQRCSFRKPENMALDLEPVETLLNTPKPFRVIVKER